MATRIRDEVAYRLGVADREAGRPDWRKDEAEVMGAVSDYLAGYRGDPVEPPAGDSDPEGPDNGPSDTTTNADDEDRADAEMWRASEDCDRESARLETEYLNGEHWSDDLRYRYEQIDSFVGAEAQNDEDDDWPVFNDAGTCFGCGGQGSLVQTAVGKRMVCVFCQKNDRRIRFDGG